MIELSLLIIPVADGTPRTASLFDVSEQLTKKPAALKKLEEVKQVEGGPLWLRYSFNKPA